jgi:hypothetical protein
VPLGLPRKLLSVETRHPKSCVSIKPKNKQNFGQSDNLEAATEAQNIHSREIDASDLGGPVRSHGRVLVIFGTSWGQTPQLSVRSQPLLVEVSERSCVRLQ